MSKKVFVSYCHAQGDWVWERLVPCLRAGGAEVFIDRERFEAGKAVIGQMDAAQDAAEVSVLVLSPEYLKSPYCVHEMDRAIDHDPQFQKGLVIPIKQVECTIPDKIKMPNPLYVNLCNDRDAGQWDLLLRACGADLGADAPNWLHARDEILQFLWRNESVNLVVSGNPKWHELIGHLRDDFLEDLGIVDLGRGAAVPRQGLVEEILKAFGIVTTVPAEPKDLVVLDRMLSARSLSRLALLHFDLVNFRPHYGIDLFSTLRYLLMESRKLVLLAQSRTPFAALLPQNHPLSTIDMKTVELKGR
ncbi:toll/interleukin-1 receptor domain-containing protein [Candidatus Poribacteria bacterium]|nr:toll/interleukin-1 receptor domain-containing protein [Candidatus Poribacteria bacterium]